MERIYLDMDQCHRFGVDYYARDGKVAVAADAVLRSKPQGYDQEHRDYLTPLGGATLRLEADSEYGPGWFTVAEIVR